MSKPAQTDEPLLDPIAERWSPRAFAERESAPRSRGPRAETLIRGRFGPAAPQR